MLIESFAMLIKCCRLSRLTAVSTVNKRQSESVRWCEREGEAEREGKGEREWAHSCATMFVFYGRKFIVVMLGCIVATPTRQATINIVYAPVVARILQYVLVRPLGLSFSMAWLVSLLSIKLYFM